MNAAAAPAFAARWLATRSQAGVAVGAGLGWVMLAALSLQPAGHHAMHSGAMPGHLLLHALAMATVMLVPATVAPLAHVSRSSFRRRRMRHAATFVGAFLTVWCVAALGIAALAMSVSVLPSPAYCLAVAVATAITAVWHASAWRRQATMRCHCTLPIYPDGSAGVVSNARYGAVIGWACVRSCGPAMAVAMLLPFPLLAMAAAMLLLTHEQAARPSAVRTNAGRLWAISAMALGAAILTAV